MAYWLFGTGFILELEGKKMLKMVLPLLYFQQIAASCGGKRYYKNNYIYCDTS